VRGSVDVGLPAGGATRVLGSALATSGSPGRRWWRDGRAQHHLIDPRTGRPAASRWAEVTVAGPSCLHADVSAKAAFLLSADGPDWLDERGLPGRFRGTDGAIVVNARWSEELGETAAAA
jgi:FAD:protein FMN transferase